MSDRMICEGDAGEFPREIGREMLVKLLRVLREQMAAEDRVQVEATSALLIAILEKNPGILQPDGIQAYVGPNADGSDRFVSIFLYLCYVGAPPELFDAFVDAYPEGLEECNEGIQMPIKSFLLLYGWNWDSVKGPRIHMAQRILELYPRTFDAPFHHAFREEIAPKELLQMIFQNTGGRHILMDSINAMISEEIRREWLQDITLEHTSRDEDEFPIDAVEYLFGLHSPDTIELQICAKEHGHDFSENIEISILDDHAAPGRTKMGIKCLITNAPNTQQSPYHLSSIVSAFSKKLIPIHRIEMQEALHDEEGYECAANEMNIEALTLDRADAAAINGLRYLYFAGTIRGDAQAFHEFALSLKAFPTRLEEINLFLKLDKDLNINSMFLEQAFALLGEENIGCLRLYLGSGYNFPERALEEFFSRRSHLGQLSLHNYRLPTFDPLSRLLNEKSYISTKVEELDVYGAEDYSDPKCSVESIHRFMQYNYGIEWADPEWGLTHTVRMYCSMNKAKRHLMLKEDATKEDAVAVLLNATKDVNTLFHLLKIRPDLWSK